MNQQDLQILFLASGLTSSINLLLDQLSQKTVDTEYVRFLAEHLESCLVGVQKKWVPIVYYGQQIQKT